MAILIDIVYAVFLLAAGSIAVCVYFQPERKFSTEALKITKYKALYLASGLVACFAVIIMLNAVYQSDLIHRMKLLSLVLVILPIAAVDYRKHIMPNMFILAGLIIRICIFIVEFFVSIDQAWITLKDCLLGAAVIGLFFLIILLVFKNSIGMGDVKLFALMGLYQGLWGAVNSVFFSLVVTFILSIFLLITKKKKRKDLIAFGPCILLGTVLAVCLAGI